LDEANGEVLWDRMRFISHRRDNLSINRSASNQSISRLGY
jgi:hypothetical protein